MNIVITGASRGIGAAMADLYTEQGHSVVGTARSSAAGVQLDVTRPGNQRAMAKQLEGHEVDLLVCNAGVYLDKHEDFAEGYGADLWQQSFAANVMGVFLSVQALMPHLKAAKAPKIAIIASQMGSNERAGGSSYIYRASKAAAVNLGRNLALDLMPQGVAVGIYHPGWVQTDMGGAQADITVEHSARGLIDCFKALSLETSGCFQSYDGTTIPF